MRVLTLSPEFDRSDAVRRLQFAPDGRAFAAVVGQPRAPRAVAVWDLVADQERALEYVAGGDRDEYTEPAVSPDLTRVAYHAYQDTAGVDYVVLQTIGGAATEFGGDSEDISLTCLCFTPDGRELMAGFGHEDAPYIARWDVAELLRGGHQAESFAREPSINLDDREQPTALACSPVGRVVAVGWLGAVSTIDPESGEVLRTLLLRRFTAKRKTPAVKRMAFSPDGQRLAALVGDTVSVWDVTRGGTGKPLAELSGPKKLTDVGWSPDGRTLATACADGTVTFWSVPDGFAERERFDWRLGPLTAVAFAPDGLTCAAGADAGRVVIWDVD